MNQKFLRGMEDRKVMDEYQDDRKLRQRVMEQKIN